jgi:SM-20-related protein
LPEWGRTVIFKSDLLEHEVMVSEQDRLSITGWLK